MPKNTLNNIMLENSRKNPLYKSVITDLALCGAIDVAVAERILGYEIPDYLKPPRHLQAKSKPLSTLAIQQEVTTDVTQPEQEVITDVTQPEQEEQPIIPMTDEKSSEFLQNTFGVNAINEG